MVRLLTLVDGFTVFCRRDTVNIAFNALFR